MNGLLEVFLISMAPFSELRGAIPIGISFYNLPIWQVVLVSILGNMVPVIIIIPLMERVSSFLSKNSSFFKNFFNKLFERTTDKHLKKFEKYRNFALILLVAIPLPLTGVWTASLCSFIFKIPFKIAFPLILIGVIIASIIVTLITLGILNFL